MNNTETFLSNTNLQQHYKFVTQEVKKRTGINIDRYPNMSNQFQKMALIIAKKRNNQNVPLSELNSDLKNHCTNYFCQQLVKKREERKQNNNQFMNDNDNNKYNNIISQRNNDANIHTPIDFEPKNLILSNKNINKQDNSKLTKVLENALLERGQINDIADTNIPDNEKPNILPFNLNDDVANMLSSIEPGEDLPLYQNVMELSQNNDPMQRLAQIEKDRQNTQTLENTTSILDYRKLDTQEQQKMAKKFMTNRGENDIIHQRNMTDAITLNQQTEIKQAAELYRVSDEGRKKMIDRMTNSSISGNDVRSLSPLIDNVLLEKLITLQRDLQPKYIEKVNYIIINSIDRDWFNTNETRYNFKVNFRPHSTHTGAGIQDLFRNITSVELVNAILPQDNVHIPFDCRPYLDILHFPYLLLQIPEFSDVFRGTNNNNDRAFSVLIYDKQHDSSVLSNDFITGGNSIVNGTPSTQFYKEYRKTFYKYTPAYFEKKNYYNQPLASLGYMTLILATPAGEKINALNDVLTINDIKYTSAISGLTEGNFEYDLSHSYPNDGSATSRKYVRIETTSSFSNKLFRLGDNIRIQGYDIQGSGTNNTRFINFINRIEGHYILNTDITDLTPGGNQGFTGNIYIAPPGDLNNTLDGLDTNTYYDETNIDLSNYSTNSNVGKLINGNLQTHFLFKINTREGDVAQVTMPMNV